MCQCWNASLLLVQAQPGLALDYPPPRGGRGWAKAELYVWGEGARKELVEAASLSPPPAPPLKTESGGGVARVSLRAWEERRSDQATKPGPDAAAPLPPSGMRRGSGSEAPPLFSPPPPQSAAFLHPPSGSSLARSRAPCPALPVSRSLCVRGARARARSGLSSRPGGGKGGGGVLRAQKSRAVRTGFPNGPSPNCLPPALWSRARGAERALRARRRPPSLPPSLPGPNLKLPESPLLPPPHITEWRQLTFHPCCCCRCLGGHLPFGAGAASRHTHRLLK